MYKSFTPKTTKFCQEKLKNLDRWGDVQELEGALVLSVPKSFLRFYAIPTKNPSRLFCRNGQTGSKIYM